MLLGVVTQLLLSTKTKKAQIIETITIVKEPRFAVSVLGREPERFAEGAVFVGGGYGAVGGADEGGEIAVAVVGGHE
jgi:hypothetical protein